MEYRILKQSNHKPTEGLELHVLARAYRSAWRRIHGSEPIHKHVLPSLDLLIEYESMNPEGKRLVEQQAAEGSAPDMKLKIARSNPKGQMKTAIPKAPTSFLPNPADLFEHAKHVMPDPGRVKVFHEILRDYLKTHDPVYLVRQVAELERGETIRPPTHGHRIRASDNAPAWWIHYQLFVTPFTRPADISQFISSMPSHMFNIKLPEDINQAGWHVAHILNTNNRDTDFQGWRKQELARRMALNIHPCNHFYIPLTNWQDNGRRPDVLNYFQQKYAEIYRDIWGEFTAMTNPPTLECRLDMGKPIPKPPDPSPPQNAPTRANKCDVTYSYSRLCFKADIIERLTTEQRFCVSTPDGKFSMTKQEFCDTFSNVVRSESYSKNRIYNYRTTPKKAMPYKCRCEEK